MYPRSIYEMSEEDLKAIREACRPVPVMMIGGVSPSSPQRNANRVWRKLGEKMNFDYMTVRPIEGKPPRFFSAIPLETKSERERRLKEEEEEKKLAEIAKLSNEIRERQERLTEIRQTLNKDKEVYYAN